MAPSIGKRGLNLLSARKVATLLAPGRHADGGGLYLIVEASGAKRWAYIYRWKSDPSSSGAGRLREMGLGGLNAVSLAEARELAEDARRQKQRGIDPISSRRRATDVPTFGVIADEVIRVKTQSMRSDKSVARIRRSLVIDAAPLRSMRVDAVVIGDVLAVLQPIWTKKPRSADATRGYIEAVFDAAKARGFRTGDNLASWRGNLDQLLSAKQKLTRGHHKALAYNKVPAFVRVLRADPRVAASAFEFLILTAARTNEVLGLQWNEIDEVGRIWTVPASRMKMGREHRVPLSARAMEILISMKARPSCDYVFPGQKAGRPLSNMAFAMFLRRREMEATAHGFRSGFRDWVGEETTFEDATAEAALAHSIGNETVKAYRRLDALEKRRTLMDAWAAYCGGADKVSKLTIVANG